MKKKILLIDDDEDLLRSFQVTLENYGFDVITGFDGKNGFLMLKNDKPDLLVLDVMMNTNLEGFNLLHVIKKEPEYKKLPIIMLTGMRDLMGVNLYSAVEDESLFPNVRFQDKPINPHYLLEIIEEMLKE
ncbi:MAG: response regulator [Bacteroidales bacterium]|jgi:DNA-binding response OmpR family regulator